MPDSPPFRFPTAVRTASTMTVSRISLLRSLRSLDFDSAHRPVNDGSRRSREGGIGGCRHLPSRNCRPARGPRWPARRAGCGRRPRSAAPWSAASATADPPPTGRRGRRRRRRSPPPDTTQVTRFRACASAASIVSASSVSRFACCKPTSFGSSQEPPRSIDRPRLEKIWENVDSGVATTKSQPSARFHPAPTATPVTLATVGIGSSCNASATSVRRCSLYFG